MGRAIRSWITAFVLTAGATLAAAASDIADDILARSIERYSAGELQPAIGGINAALRGRLSGSQLARAYYFRGLAYRKSGQPGLAITDLTRALEYNGLTDAERSDARENLQVAYQEAGISPSERVVIAPVTGEQPKAATPEATVEKPAAPPPAAVISATASVDRATTGTNTAGGSWQTKTAIPPAPPAARPEPPRWVAEQISTTQLPAVPATAKAVAVPAAPERKQRVAARSELPPPAARPLAPFVTQVAAEPAPAVAAEVVLLVGEAYSRSEAFALAVRLTSQRGAELGPRRPQIAEARLADAAVYRLRLGPFNDAGQALALCRSLRDSGYACVTE